jgi:hypothetical protein
VSECARKSDTHASYVLSVAAHLEVLEKRELTMERVSKLLQLLYFIPTHTAPVPPTTGPRELSRTLTEPGVHERGGQETPPKRLTTSLSHLICDIGRTTRIFPESEMLCLRGKTKTSDRSSEIVYQGQRLEIPMKKP